jgi:hypothetical protein
MAMKRRCKDGKYHHDRGIIICERWKDFENFLSDMGERPTNLTIERIDNNGNYEPSNCRWASVKQQARNRRASRYITFINTTKTLAQWAEDLGINITPSPEIFAN